MYTDGNEVSSERLFLYHYTTDEEGSHVGRSEKAGLSLPSCLSSSLCLTVPSFVFLLVVSLCFYIYFLTFGLQFFSKLTHLMCMYFFCKDVQF